MPSRRLIATRTSLRDLLPIGPDFSRAFRHTLRIYRLQHQLDAETGGFSYHAAPLEKQIRALLWLRFHLCSRGRERYRRRNFSENQFARCSMQATTKLQAAWRAELVRCRSRRSNQLVLRRGALRETHATRRDAMPTVVIIASPILGDDPISLFCTGACAHAGIWSRMFCISGALCTSIHNRETER